jgi:hypothetical protein
MFGVQGKSYLLQNTSLQDENFPVIGLRCLIQTQDVCFDILIGGLCNKQGEIARSLFYRHRNTQLEQESINFPSGNGRAPVSTFIYFLDKFSKKYRGTVSHRIFVILSAQKSWEYDTCEYHSRDLKTEAVSKRSYLSVVR